MVSRKFISVCWGKTKSWNCVVLRRCDLYICSCLGESMFFKLELTTVCISCEPVIFSIHLVSTNLLLVFIRRATKLRSIGVCISCGFLKIVYWYYYSDFVWYNYGKNASSFTAPQIVAMYSPSTKTTTYNINNLTLIFNDRTNPPDGSKWTF